jgi:hypothetical protein
MRSPPLAILVLASAGLATGAAAQPADPTTLRPTDVSVTITNDRHYSGTYNASGISRICGKLDFMMPHRANSFVVEFPDDEVNLPVRSVSFDADTLATGGTATRFSLNVAIRPASGGTPPAYVVRAKEPRYNEPGTATRATTAGKDVLTVEGIATTGTRVGVRMVVTCHPKK